MLLSHLQRLLVGVEHQRVEEGVLATDVAGDGLDLGHQGDRALAPDQGGWQQLNLIR